MNERTFVCAECGAPPDCPQLNDEVWAQIAGPRDLLCITHAEAKLGREIQPEDLRVCPANAFSLLLAHRLRVKSIDDRIRLIEKWQATLAKAKRLADGDE